jgi:hypothetical protein
MKPIMTIDFEASCLPRHGRSFPIEVGIADPRGNARSWLIRPHASWSGWTWTAEAQALHGLTLDHLVLHGQSADHVMAELISVTRDYRIVADSKLDSAWLETLAHAATQAVPWPIDHVATLFDELDITSEDIRSALAMMDRVSRRRHRAGDDAAWLAGLIRHLQETATRRLEAENRPIFTWNSVPVAVPASG